MYSCLPRKWTNTFSEQMFLTSSQSHYNPISPLSITSCAFQQGFKHLEETGRLQLARFTNTADIKTLLPIQDGYKHTGMQIRLHKSDRAGRQRARSALDVTYNCNESRLGVIFHFLLNIVSASRSSTVSEYQHRLNSTREYRLALGDGGKNVI